MPNWLDKFSPPQPPKGQVNRNLPAYSRKTWLSTFLGQEPPAQPNTLPNASVIYGIGASALAVIALYFIFFGHRLFSGIMVLLLAIALLGFALHFLKYPR
jgi:hypothetical protein